MFAIVHQRRPRMKLVLASSSPRRAHLLSLLGVVFDVIPAAIDESPQPGESPERYVRRLALAKANAVLGLLDDADCVVIGSDTTIDVDGQIIGKPVDRRDAAEMLRVLSGRTHVVHTGLAVLTSAIQRVSVVRTEIDVMAISTAQIDWYLSTGEADDKAGAYALQGAGGAFVRGVKGSVSGVVGLPLAELVAELRAVGMSSSGSLG